jgi:hypothetical protein
MLEELQIQEVNKQIADEAANLGKLKKKMESIKKSAHALNVEKNETMCHDHAIHNGGYFMFDGDEQIENEQLINESELGVSSSSEIKRRREKKTVTFNSDRSSLNVTYKEIVVEKSKTVKKVFSFGLLKIVQKMHKLSRNYSFIVQTMEREKRMLKESMTPAPNDSHHML